MVEDQGVTTRPPAVQVLLSSYVSAASVQHASLATLNSWKVRSNFMCGIIHSLLDDLRLEAKVVVEKLEHYISLPRN